MGNLKHLAPTARRCNLSVSPTVRPASVAAGVRWCCILPHLRHLSLRFDTTQQTVTGGLVACLAELPHLRSLRCLGGRLDPGADLSLLSSLRQLSQLELLPAHGTGINDEQVCLSVWLWEGGSIP